MIPRRQQRTFLLTVPALFILFVAQLERLLKLSFHVETDFGNHPFWMMGNASTLEIPAQPHPKETANQLFHYPPETSEARNTSTYISSRPHLILHVGPQKAMSSTLQCQMRRYTHRNHLRWGTPYYFVGKVDPFSCTGRNGAVNGGPFLSAFQTDCAKQIAEQADDNISNITCWKDYLGFMGSSYRENQSLVVSEEKFSEYHVKDWLHESSPPKMADAFWNEVHKSQQDWNVDIVVVYRRYYSWLASLKNQGDKYILGRPAMRYWHGPETEPILPNLLRWMTEQSAPSPFVDDIVKEYRDSRGFKVVLLNMHDGTNLLEEFFCHVMLPHDSNQVCKLHRRLMKKAPKNLVFNPSINPFYDIICYEAKKRGMLRRRNVAAFERPDVATAAKEYQEQVLGLTPYDFPLICPTDEEVEPLLARSLEYERQLIPEFFESPLGQKKLKEEFWADVRAKKFCTVNVDKVLTDPIWVSFFNRLDEFISNSTIFENSIASQANR